MEKTHHQCWARCTGGAWLLARAQAGRAVARGLACLARPAATPQARRPLKQQKIYLLGHHKKLMIYVLKMFFQASLYTTYIYY